MDATGQHEGTPLGWALHGSEHGWHVKTGDYAAVVELLLTAGAQAGENPSKGTEAVKAVFRRFKT